jgi:hypothetical protein
LAALEANAAVNTGNALANGPGVAVENTGGNVELGKGHSESHVQIGNPADIPAIATPSGLSTLSTPAAPAGDTKSRVKAIVDAARARAQAQIDAARAAAAEAVARAEQQANDARARSDQQSQDARAHAEDSSASSSSWSSSTND